MKKLIIILLFLLTASLNAEYISSFKANVYEKSDNSTIKFVLNKNQYIQVLEQKGSWLKIKSGSQTGWIKKMFTRSIKSEKFSILGNASENARIHSRVRASSSVTAASARGLQDDNSNMRNRTNTDLIIMDEVRQIEQIYISEEELLKFLAEIK